MGDRCGLELATALDHHFESVGQLNFAIGTDIFCQKLSERIAQGFGVFNVIDADERFVADEFLRFFDKFCDVPGFIRNGDSKTARIRDFIGIKDVFLGVFELV